MDESAAPLFIGTAGWTIPREGVDAFPGEGTHLQRYAARFNAAEINSSFHRPHRASTYERWAASVPDGFRFSVKMPKAITHAARLKEVEVLLDDFLGPVQALGPSLGCILVQLPPSFAYEAAVVVPFFSLLRDRFAGGLACEPRHATWLEPAADDLLVEHRVARVAADPDKPAGAGEPGGWSGLQYYRLHGSPLMYYSSYEQDYLEQLARRLTSSVAEGRTTWCIFDNTTLGAAAGNAREVVQLIASPGVA